MSAEERIAQLGVDLVEVPPPPEHFSWARRDGDLCYVSGHGPLRSNGTFVIGKVGADLDLDEGREAARLAGATILATLRSALGSLDRVDAVVKLFGMVNVAPDFADIPAVVDACSELFIDVFGERGIHARSAVGMAQLPFGIAVEIEAIVRVV